MQNRAIAGSSPPQALQVQESGGASGCETAGVSACAGPASACVAGLAAVYAADAFSAATATDAATSDRLAPAVAGAADCCEIPHRLQNRAVLGSV